MREPGYYWVMDYGQRWRIAEFHDTVPARLKRKVCWNHVAGYWLVCGHETPLPDPGFRRIGRRILDQMYEGETNVEAK